MNPFIAIVRQGPAWFILHEATHRGNDPELIRTGTTILDWMWRRGWDQQHGGIIYFRDVKDLPVREYWQDMKFWWPQNEAIIASSAGSCCRK